MNKTLQSIHKIAESNLVDVVGGTTNIKEWLSDVQWQHSQRNPKVCVLVLEQIDDGRYRGALYITKEDFRNEN